MPRNMARVFAELRGEGRRMTESYKKWLECMEAQIAEQPTLTRFRLAFLSRRDLGLTSKELRKGRGVGAVKVLNRLDRYNEEHGLKLKPCRPAIPFLLYANQAQSAPFHLGFVGTGLVDAKGRKINVHYYGPLDIQYIGMTRQSSAMCYEYYDDGYWEPTGPREFVFER